VRKFEQERCALLRWGGELSATPRLIGAHLAPPHGLLLGEVPGGLVEGATLPAKTLAEVHRAAGAWLQTLHALPHLESDPMALSTALQERLGRWSERATGIVRAHTLAWVKEQMADLQLDRLRRVPCHRDF